MTIPIGTIVQIVRLGADALDGSIDPHQAARTLVSAGLDMVPVEDLKRYLEEDARARAELAADAAELAKFGRT